MKKFLFVAAILFAGYSYINNQHKDNVVHTEAPLSTRTVASSLNADQSDATIENAMASRKSNVQVSGQGVVVKLLADDNNGSRHQKFIVKLATGNTVLIAHNIDLASRVNGLSEGDSIQFQGEYEWNEKGGVLHWTHKDPNGSHPTGWLQHHGQNYQ